MLKLLRWHAYDTGFLPNRGDTRFISWIRKGLTTYFLFTCKKYSAVFSHYWRNMCCKGMTFRYLQVNDHFNQTCIFKEATVELEVCKIRKSAFILVSTKSVTRYNSGIGFTVEAWGEIEKLQFSTTNSVDWREYCWKYFIRYFQTPYQDKYRNASSIYWRQCG